MAKKPKSTSASSTASGGANGSAFIQHVRLTGRTRGLVKNLGGFNKKHHNVPDYASAAATAFLGKLCSAELAVEAEAFFQKARAAFAYKRKDISLDIASPSAVLAARHFTLEWAYALDEAEPSEWTLTLTLHTLDFAPSSTTGNRNDNDSTAAAFDELFAGMFDSIVFTLTKGARIEDVIDAVESLDTAEASDLPASHAALTVTYPSDCSTCTLRVADVAAEVVFTGGELSMVFPRAGAPRDLIEAFIAVRQAFALTRHPALAGLL